MADNWEFKKYVYWVDADASPDVVASIKEEGRSVHKAKQQPCEALYPRREVVWVRAKVWDIRCRRQGAWYRNSERAGHDLLVTNEPLTSFTAVATIRLAPFEPPRLADDADVVELMKEEARSGALPPGWGDFSAWELESLQKYLQDQKVERTLQEMFCYYSANHLNFLFPRFFVTDREYGTVPYAIQETPLVCSACVELFGLVGNEHAAMYLCPCPGLKYVQAPRGQYLLVTRS